jgi:hypothetical protein
MAVTCSRCFSSFREPIFPYHHSHASITSIYNRASLADCMSHAACRVHVTHFQVEYLIESVLALQALPLSAYLIS